MPKVKLWDDLTTAQKVKRWEGVERVMKKLSPHQRKNHFDMRFWGKKTDCGTVACIAGHCGLDPSFRRQGFRINVCYTTYFDKVGPAEFFGQAAFYGIFIRTRDTYSQARANVADYLAKLRADAKRS